MESAIFSIMIHAYSDKSNIIEVCTFQLELLNLIADGDANSVIGAVSDRFNIFSI